VRCIAAVVDNMFEGPDVDKELSKENFEDQEYVRREQTQVEHE
jgi:hypothetical protein